MASSANLNKELALVITASATGVTGLRQFAETHPPVSPGEAPLVAVMPAGNESFSPDRASRGVSIKRVIVTGDSARQASENARKVWSYLVDRQFSLASYRVCLRGLEEPSFFRQENDVFFQNMRFRIVEAQTA